MAWRSVKLQERAELLRRVHAIEPHTRFSFENAEVEVRPLSFYPGGLLVRCRNPGWRVAADYLWYVYLPGREAVALDGSVANIHHLNFHAPLCLTEESLPGYLKFRFSFGHDGSGRRELQDVMEVQKADDGGFVCLGLFPEGGRRIRVDKHGVVEIL